MMQQYPRHIVFSLGNLMFDIKQYAAWIVALITYFLYVKRHKVDEGQQ